MAIGFRNETFLEDPHIKGFELRASPRSLAKEPQTGGDRGFKKKAANRDRRPEAFPADLLDQAGQDHLKRHAMQRIFQILMRQISASIQTVEVCLLEIKKRLTRLWQTFIKKQASVKKSSFPTPARAGL